MRGQESQTSTPKGIARNRNKIATIRLHILKGHDIIGLESEVQNMKLLELKTNDLEWEMHNVLLNKTIMFYGVKGEKRTAYFSRSVALIESVERFGIDCFWELSLR